MIPLVHDFDGERVLVFGGGTVGARKARHLCIRTAPTPADAPEWLSRTEPVLDVVSVSTGTTGPALSRYLRDQIESTIENAGNIAELMSTLREAVSAETITEKWAALRAVLESEHVWKALDTESTNPRQVATDVMGETR